jgi:peroxiredoxin
VRLLIRHIAPCSSQVPGYLNNYSKFVEKGVKDIYIVAVNDVFVVKAWKASLEGGTGSDVHFCADSTGIPSCSSRAERDISLTFDR